MSDYRNANDPWGRDSPYDLNARGGSSVWGWIAGAVLLAIVLALAFGSAHMSKQTGTNNMANNSPATQRQPAPAPNGPAGTSYSPGPVNPPNPTPLNPVQPQPKP
jgi:hypothetical protein